MRKPVVSKFHTKNNLFLKFGTLSLPKLTTKTIGLLLGERGHNGTKKAFFPVTA